MKKYGTGATQAIWKWWEDFHKEHVYEKGFVGMLKGIFPFIITIIGVIIMAIVDTFVAFFVWFGGLFNSTDDDDSRDLINRSSCEQINRFGNDQIIAMIHTMLDGPTGDDDENAMLKLFRCLPCDRLSTIVNQIGVSNIQSEFHGQEYDELQLIFGNCNIISFSSWDDDVSRLFINRANCNQLNSLNDNNIVTLIQNMLSGFTGDDDENAILKLLGCLPCPRLHTIVGRVGRSNLESAINGSEYDRLRVLFGNCGIINFSSWDDDATRLFINSSPCSVLNGLSMNNIMALIQNLFDGATGDDDENAIIKLIQCLDAAKVQDLLTRPGFSRDDFDDEVDGSEWTTLRNIFNAKGA